MTLVELGYPRGKFAEVQADALGWCVVLQDEATGHLVFCQLDPEGERRVPDISIAAFGGNAFPVLYVAAGATWLAFRDGVTSRGVLMNLTTGAQVDLGSVHGNSPIALGRGRVWYQADARYALRWRALDAPRVEQASVLTGRPTGIAGLDGIGLPVLVDDNRLSEPGMSHPQRAGRCIVGENADAGPSRNIARLALDGRECEVWPGLDSFTPRIATDGNAFAVVTWGAGRTRLALLTDPPDFRPVVVAPPPPPVPQPRPPAPPVPVPPKPEKPMPPAVTPDPELTLLAQRLEKKYSAPAADGGLGRGPTETHVDVLGASRWRRDYFFNRDAGDSPDQAWAKVNGEINRIVGLPAGADPNRPQ